MLNEVSGSTKVVRDAINCRGKVEDWACSDDDSLR